MEHKDHRGSLCIPFRENETYIYTKDPKLVAEDFNLFFLQVGRNVAEAAE